MIYLHRACVSASIRSCKLNVIEEVSLQAFLTVLMSVAFLFTFSYRCQLRFKLTLVQAEAGIQCGMTIGTSRGLRGPRLDHRFLASVYLSESGPRSTTVDILFLIHLAPNTIAPMITARPATDPTTIPAISLGYSLGPPTIENDSVMANAVVF